MLDTGKYYVRVIHPEYMYIYIFININLVFITSATQAIGLHWDYYLHQHIYTVIIFCFEVLSL